MAEQATVEMPTPDLRAVDELCLLVLAAQRLGCTVRLDGVTDEVRSLLDLAGVGDVLLDPHTPTETSRDDLR